MTKKQKKEKTVEILIDRMFEIAGHDVSFKDIQGRTDSWYLDWTMTVEQNEQWKTWGVEFIRKNLKISKKAANFEMGWVSLMWGLKFSDFE